MSKTPPAVDFKPGDVVLSKVKGFPAWPSVIVDSETAPPSVKKEKPKGGAHYLVRFMPLGEFGWPTTKDVTALTGETIQKMMDKDKKKTGKLFKGLELAKDPSKWISEKEAENQKQVEAEADAEVDQLDDEEEGEKKKTKGRKAAAAGGKKKKAVKDDEDSAPKKKRVARKRKAGGDESDDEVKPSKKKAKKDDEEDASLAALANDPEAAKIKEWRHQLQRAFLRDNMKPEPNALPEYDETFNIIENYQGLTIQYLSYSKIGKVMKKISQLPDKHIPDNDGQFRFRERASKLVTQWHGILNAKSSETDGAPAVNGTGEKSDDAAPAADTTAAAGDISIMTEA